MQHGGTSPVLQESTGRAGCLPPGLGGCQADRRDVGTEKRTQVRKACGEEGQEHRAWGPRCADAQRGARRWIPERQERSSVENTMAPVRAVREEARGQPGAGRHRPGQGARLQTRVRRAPSALHSGIITGGSRQKGLHLLQVGQLRDRHSPG